MNFSKSLHAIDSHTMGEPNRTIIGGLPTILERLWQKKKST